MGLDTISALMDEILLCTSDPILLKNLYAMLRDCGFWVDTTEQTAAAVQMALRKPYRAVILDAACVGLSAGDAARVLDQEREGMPVIVVGGSALPSGSVALNRPPDLEELRYVVRSIQNNADKERRVAG